MIRLAGNTLSNANNGAGAELICPAGPNSSTRRHSNIDPLSSRPKVKVDLELPEPKAFDGFLDWLAGLIAEELVAEIEAQAATQSSCHSCYLPAKGAE